MFGWGTGLQKNGGADACSVSVCVHTFSLSRGSRQPGAAARCRERGELRMGTAVPSSGRSNRSFSFNITCREPSAWMVLRLATTSGPVSSFIYC